MSKSFLKIYSYADKKRTFSCDGITNKARVCSFL